MQTWLDKKDRNKGFYSIDEFADFIGSIDPIYNKNSKYRHKKIFRNKNAAITFSCKHRNKVVFYG